MFDQDRFVATLKHKIGRTPLRVIASESGVSVATLSRMTNNHPPDMETFSKLLVWMRVPASDFFPDAPQEPTQGSAWVDLYRAMNALGASKRMQEALADVIRVFNSASVTVVAPPREGQPQ